MQFLKIKIIRDQNDLCTSYTYPPEYKAEKIQVLCYESSVSDNLSEIIARGNIDEYLLGAIKDEDASSLLASKDVILLTEAEALVLGNKWTRTVEFISDPERVIAICKRIVAGATLTRADLDAIDPTKKDSGIITKGLFSDAIEKMKVAL